MIESKLYEVNEKVAEFYNEQLYKYTKALDYLKIRNINNNMIEEFEIGYASQDNSVYEYLKEKGYTEDVIYASGLIIKTEEGKIVDKFRNRIMFPIKNEDGQIVALGGRTIDANNMSKYINTSDNLIYTKAKNLYGINIAKDHITEKLIIVEGYTDVISLNQIGIKNVVALLGVAITDEQIQLIKKYTNDVIVVLDSDMAGQCAAKKVDEKLNAEGIHTRVIFLEDAKDSSEYISKIEKNKFKELINNVD